MFKGLNRFVSLHALGFSFYNILHLTNRVTNGLRERFPKLPVIWIFALIMRNVVQASAAQEAAGEPNALAQPERNRE